MTSLRKYVVAINRKDAEDLASLIGHDTLAQANEHLREVKAPPTDPYYANQYRVYPVKVTERPESPDVSPEVEQ